MFAFESSLSWSLETHKVDKEDPGAIPITELHTAEGSAGELVVKKPTWTTARGERLGSLCWIDHLFQSNRERLYAQVVDAVLKKTSVVSQNTLSKQSEVKRVPFRLVKVPADGRCGWRSILAAGDHEAYERVPRTAVYVCMCVCNCLCICGYIYIYIYVYMYIYTHIYIDI